MDELKNYIERHHRRVVKIDGKRIIIENTEQLEKLFRDKDSGGVETKNISDVAFCCDCCSAEVRANDCIRIKDMILDRDCAAGIVEEILDRSVEEPGSVDPETVMTVRLLRAELRRQRRAGLRAWLIRWLEGKGSRGKQ